MGLFLSFKKKKFNNFFIKRTVLKSNARCIIWTPSSFISKSFSNFKVLLYTGKIFVTVIIRNEMVGFRFGEFFVTRKLGSKVIRKK